MNTEINIKLEPGKLFEVDYRGHKYGLIYYNRLNPETNTLQAEKFGVCANGYGKIKYMRVSFDPCTGYFPRLHKTMLKARGAAAIMEALLVCDKLDSAPNECISICEHILQHGKTPR